MPYITKVEAENAKRQICAAYNDNNEYWRTLANELGVKRTTAYRWVKNQSENVKPRGGKRHKKITNENRDFMEKCIEENPRVTLKQLQEKLENDQQIVVSTECVRKNLRGLIYTFKDFPKEPRRANSEVTKEERREYVQQLLQYQADNIPVVYTDVTNFSLYVSGTKEIRRSNISEGSRRSNIHVMACMGNLGLIHHQIRRGAFQQPGAHELIRICLRNAQSVYKSKVAMVIDMDSPCYASIEDVFREDEFIGHCLLRLSPYSPMFNVSELGWSSLKVAVKSGLAIKMPHINLAGEDGRNITETEFRLQWLENIVRENIMAIFSVANCARYFTHIERYIADALNLMDIPF